MLRFTIGHHRGSEEGDHYDLMLERGEILKTWRLPAAAFDAPRQARQTKDHRKLYLDYEGEIPGQRGYVEIHDTGTYTVEEWTQTRIRVALAGRRFRGRILLERAKDHPEAPEPPWTVSDAAADLRKATAAFLRTASLEEAPTSELDGVRRALVLQERRILRLVDRYGRGEEVPWALAGIDEDLHRRIDREKTRWQHPWLAAAKSYSDSLKNLAALLQRHRPTLEAQGHGGPGGEDLSSPPAGDG